MSSTKDFFNKIKKNPVICVLRAPTSEKAENAIDACIQGGLENIEITLSTPDALRVLKKAKEKYPRAQFGIGTITNLEEAEAVTDTDVDFYISPHTNQELIDYMKSKNLLYIPGANTPSELMNLHNQNIEIQKLFPASLHGSRGVSTLLAPMPFLNLIVTGGVSLENAYDFLNAGAKAICVGGNLFKKDYFQKDDYQALKEEARKWSQITSFS